MAIITDRAGRVIGQKSAQFELSLTAQQMEELRSQNAILERLVELPPGSLPAELRLVVVVGQNERIAATVLNLADTG